MDIKSELINENTAIMSSPTGSGFTIQQKSPFSETMTHIYISKDDLSKIIAFMEAN